jgi:DNA polymerase I
VAFMYSGSCKDKAEAIETLTSPLSWVVVDTETISIKNQECIGIGLYIPGGHSYYFPMFPEVNEHGPVIMGILGSNVTKVYFNAMFDLRNLRKMAYEEGLDLPEEDHIVDVSIMAQVSGHLHGLEGLSQELFGESNPLSIQELLEEARVQEGRKVVTMLDVPLMDVGQKCMFDVYYTYKCWQRLEKEMPSRSRECYEVDNELIGILLRAERKGLALHQGLLEYNYTTLRQSVMQSEGWARDLGFEIGSNGQVGYVLAERGNMLPFTKSGRQLRADKEALELLDDPLVPMILDFRKKSKLLSTYVIPWRGSDRAYTHYRIDLATGRLASRDRNLQNIPPHMRAVFVPDSGMYSWMDYSQIEMRLLAYISHDERMIKAYEEGRSIHEETQTGIGLASYATAKTFNFAMVYDAGVKTLAARTGLDRKTAGNYRNAWLSLYDGVHRYMVDQQNCDDEWVESEFGRRMRLPENEEGSVGYQSHIDKCKVNYVIQGTAADIIKRAMVKVKDLDLRVQVHDELVVDGDVEFPESLTTIHPEIVTPFEVHKNRTWS